MDNSKSIHALLEKYWAAETSLEEEKIIVQYFKQTTIDPDLQSVAPLFHYYEWEKEQSINVEQSVMDQIDSKIIAIPAPENIANLSWKRWVSIAASILLILSLFITTYQGQKQTKETTIARDTFQTPEEALEQTMAALAFLSAKMNKGSEKASKSLSKAEALNILN
jgi:hypothetical protein